MVPLSGLTLVMVGVTQDQKANVNLAGLPPVGVGSEHPGIVDNV